MSDKFYETAEEGKRWLTDVVETAYAILDSNDENLDSKSKRTSFVDVKMAELAIAHPTIESAQISLAVGKAIFGLQKLFTAFGRKPTKEEVTERIEAAIARMY